MLQRLMGISPEAAAETPVSLAQNKGAVGTGGEILRPGSQAACGANARTEARAAESTMGRERRTGETLLVGTLGRACRNRAI